MPDNNWTTAQREAIVGKAKAILVSASAGSGKTAVLTHRVLNKITDPDNPADISRMLIVTFSKAAAAELRERISQALAEAVAAKPFDSHLKRQYILRQKAKISTIHSFCTDVIRKNFEKVGLSPSVAIIDPTQESLMKQQIADIVIDHYYAGLPGYDDINNFPEFADNFITLQDNNLSEILLSLHESVSSLPQGIEFVADAARKMSGVGRNGIEHSPWGDIFFGYTSECLSYYAKVFSEAYDYFSKTKPFDSRYDPAFFSEWTYAIELLATVGMRDMPAIRETIRNHAPPKLLPVPSAMKNPISEFYCDEKKQFAAFLKNIETTFLSRSKEEIAQSAHSSARFLRKLYCFLKSFDQLFTAEKRKRNLLNFNDLERIAYGLLVDKDGKPTEVARETARSYDELYIDEYQDVNRLQDQIFSAIGAYSSRFMVGDIKQNIYSFRGADPSIFAAYRSDPSIHCIYLQHNFRCDKPIVQFVNLVCGRIFCEVGDTVPYQEADQLVYGKSKGGSLPVEICLIDSEAGNVETRRKEEAAYIAKRISSMIAKGTSPDDICILIRSKKNMAPLLEKSLSAYGIPCKSQVEDNLFHHPEILLIVSILQIIDNPTRDIYLAGALKSPVFNFTLSELTKIRRFSEKGSLYDALKAYTEAENLAKGRYFLEKLEEYRKLAFEPVDRLIWMIYSDLHYLALTSAGDTETEFAAKKSRLLLFYDYARRFESGGFKGLCGFLQYLEDLISADKPMKSPTTGEGSENAVRIMSIHHSKGLQFPVVFLCDTAAAFSDQDTKKNVLIDREIGMALKLSDRTGLVSVNNFMREAESLGIRNRTCDEEVRNLYVALTRAANKLIITGNPKKLYKTLKECTLFKETGFPYYFRKHNSFLEWILIATNGKYTPKIVKAPTDDEVVPKRSSPSAPARRMNTKDFLDDVNRYREEFRTRFSFRYPGSGTMIPAKLSVSELYPEILDEYNDSRRDSDRNGENMKKPALIAAEDSTAADRGTATHQFMQFCSFPLLAENGVEEEIGRLTSFGYLDGATAGLVDRKAIRRFLSSPLFDSLKNAGFLKRELRFNVKLPAALFVTEPTLKRSLAEESMLVQGVMDCVFLDEEDRLTIVDYKTDRIPRQYRSDPGAAEEYLIGKHIRQLSYYRLACEKMMCRPADRVLLYSFSLASVIEIPRDRFIVG